MMAHLIKATSNIDVKHWRRRGINRIEIWDSFVSLFILSFFSVLPERGNMEKTIGMRIRECRVKMGMTQEELAELLYIKKATVSAYENDKFDMKVSVLKDIAKVLKTTVAYLVDGKSEGISPEVMHIAMMLRDMKNKELRKAAIEQVKVLVGVDDRQ